MLCDVNADDALGRGRDGEQADLLERVSGRRQHLPQFGRDVAAVGLLLAGGGDDVAAPLVLVPGGGLFAAARALRSGTGR